MRIDLSSLVDLHVFAELLAQSIGERRGLDIAIVGPLGAGKTTLISQLGQCLGATEPVSSPSYVLQHIYKLRSGTLEHWDLYRLRAVPPELEEAPCRTVIRAVEWADRSPEYLTSCEIVVRLDYGSEPESRMVDLTVEGNLLATLKSAFGSK